MPLWLLGVGKFIGANWKIFAAIALALAAYFWFQSKMREAYKNGKSDCNAEWVKRVEKENRQNRALEQRLQEQINNLGELFAKQNQERIEKETTHTNTIREIIKENPINQECLIDQRILDERNKIRELGPK